MYRIHNQGTNLTESHNLIKLNKNSPFISEIQIVRTASKTNLKSNVKKKLD